MARKEEGEKIKIDFSNTSYILGIISIITSFFIPLEGLVLGVTGLILGNKQKTDLSKRAKTLNMIAIILSVVLYILLFVIGYFLAKYCTQNPTASICGMLSK